MCENAEESLMSQKSRAARNVPEMVTKLCVLNIKTWPVLVEVSHRDSQLCLNSRANSVLYQELTPSG